MKLETSLEYMLLFNDILITNDL